MGTKVGTRRIRVLLAKTGLDGHDRGVLVVAKALSQAGMEVIYGGLHLRPAQIAKVAAEEAVDVVGLSSLSDNHRALVPREQVSHRLRGERVQPQRCLVGEMWLLAQGFRLRRCPRLACGLGNETPQAILRVVQQSVVDRHDHRQSKGQDGALDGRDQSVARAPRGDQLEHLLGVAGDLFGDPRIALGRNARPVECASVGLESGGYAGGIVEDPRTAPSGYCSADRRGTSQCLTLLGLAAPRDAEQEIFHGAESAARTIADDVEIDVRELRGLASGVAPGEHHRLRSVGGQLLNDRSQDVLEIEACG